MDAYSHGLSLPGGADTALLRELRAQAQEHVDALAKALRGLGGKVDNEKVDGEREALDYTGVESRHDFLSFAYERESSGVAGDLSEVSKLSTPWPRSLLSSIAANQAQHLVLLRQALGAGGLASVPRRSRAARRPRPASPRRATRPCRQPVGDDAHMTAPLYAIGRFCSRHHYPVIALWVVVAIALVAIGQASGSKTSENLTLPGTDSTVATELLEENLPEQAYGSNPLVMEATKGTLTEPKYSAAVAETVKRLEALPEVNSAVSPLSPAGAAFLSKDRTIGYIPVVLGVGPGELDEAKAQRVLDAAQPARAAGLHTAVGSYVGQQLSKPSTEVSEAIGLAAAVVILLFAFGTATAMMLPIVSAVIGLACALSIIRLLEHAIQVPGVASTLATMIGLGVGIDYALFIVTRHKLQLADGMELHESISRATATAGGAVVFAGFTVVIALCSLAFAGIPLVTTLGFTAAIAVVVAVCAAATLLPAMLGALGPHINSLGIRRGKSNPEDKEPHGWLRWAKGVAARPGARRSPPWSCWSSWRCRSSSSSWARTTSAPCPRTPPRARPTTASTRASARVSAGRC